MRRRPHLAITLLALVMVGSSLVTSSPRDLAQASDPLADAKAQQEALERTLAAGNVGTVVATLGTTALGSVDPLPSGCEVDRWVLSKR